MTTHVAFERTLASEERANHQAICDAAYEKGHITVAELPDVYRTELKYAAKRKGTDLRDDAPVFVQLWHQGRGVLNAHGRLIPGVDGPDEVWTFRFRSEIPGAE